MTENELRLHTMKIYDSYERRIAKARAEKEYRDLADGNVRAKVREDIKRMLGYREELLPKIHDEKTVYSHSFDTYDVHEITYQTWSDFHSCASLYLPHGKGPFPLVFIFCGHGDTGRLTEGYVRMGHRLAQMGAAVLIPDNIGQGDRSPFGHKDALAPFYCGMSVQGMILMESVAIIRRMKQDKRFDAARFGACGNSGGGTLCTFLASLASEELSALSASGYPSEFSYIISKERRHCNCNLLPNVIDTAEMWECLSLFAPKPILLEQGKFDHFFPLDLYYRNARKVRDVYERMDKGENFNAEITEEMHSWTACDRSVIASFFSHSLGLRAVDKSDGEGDYVMADIANRNVTFPSGAVSTDEAAQRISGIKMPVGLTLSDIFTPTFCGRHIEKDEIIQDLGRGDVMRILAQMESMFTPPANK